MSDKSATKGERRVPWGKVELIRATKAERWSWDVQGRGQRKFIYTLLEQGWAHRPAASYGVCLNMSEGGMRGVGWDGEWRGVARSKIIPHSPDSVLQMQQGSEATNMASKAMGWNISSLWASSTRPWTQKWKWCEHVQTWLGVTDKTKTGTVLSSQWNEQFGLRVKKSMQPLNRTSSSLSALLNLFENTRWKSSPAYNCKAVHGDCSRQKEVTASVCGRL